MRSVRDSVPLRVQVGELKRLWVDSKSDLVIWLVTFFGTVVLGVKVGIVMGIGVSIMIVLRGASRPSIATLGRLPDTDIFRNVERYPSAAEESGIVIFRFDHALNFCNKQFFKDSVEQSIQERLASIADQGSDETQLHTLIVDCASISSIDDTSLTMLKKLLARLHEPTQTGKKATAAAAAAVADHKESLTGSSTLPSLDGLGLDVALVSCKGLMRDTLMRVGVTKHEMEGEAQKLIMEDKAAASSELQPMEGTSESPVGDSIYGGAATEPEPAKSEPAHGKTAGVCQQFISMSAAIHFAKLKHGGATGV